MWPAKRRFGFQEFARRRGDFALAAAPLFYDLDGDKSPQRPCGCHRRRRHAAAAAAVEAGHQMVDHRRRRDRQRGGSGIRRWSIHTDDIHASGAYRKALVGVMVERALRAARGVAIHAGKFRSQRQAGRGRGRAAHDAGRLPAPPAAADRHPCRLRAWRLRRLHGSGRRRCGALLPDARGAGRGRQGRHRRGPVADEG